MTRIITILIFAIATLNINAQPDDFDGVKEKVQAKKIAFITTQLDLSPEEAQKFWPIYNEHHNQLEAIRKDIDKGDRSDLSDADADRLIAQHIEAEEKQLQLKKKYIQNLKGVIPPLKIVKLFKLEERFKREIYNRLKEGMRRRKKMR